MINASFETVIVKKDDDGKDVATSVSRVKHWLDATGEPIVDSKGLVLRHGDKTPANAKSKVMEEANIIEVFDFSNMTADDWALLAQDILLGSSLPVKVASAIKADEHGPMMSLNGKSVEFDVHELLNKEKRSGIATVKAKVAAEVAVEKAKQIAIFRARMIAKGMDNAEIEAVIAEVFSV